MPTWQGGSTTNIPGTSILSGIRSVATHGTVTYSLDAGGGKVSVTETRVSVVDTASSLER